MKTDSTHCPKAKLYKHCQVVLGCHKRLSLWQLFWHFLLGQLRICEIIHHKPNGGPCSINELTIYSSSR